MRIRQCRDALERGHRDTARANDWTGRVDAMAHAAVDVFGEPWLARLRADIAAEPLVGGVDRRNAYVRAMEAGV